MSDQPQGSPRRSQRTQHGPRTPVFAYLAILFAVAFLLLLLAYFQQQRSNAEATDALKQSASAVESIQLLMEDNEKLRSQVKELESKIADLKGQITNLESNSQSETDSRKALENETAAMQWFWQVESAYARNKTADTRELIEKFESTGLPKYLPGENTTGTQRFSPAARYQEIYDSIF